jgi:hypothetical protein
VATNYALLVYAAIFVISAQSDSIFYQALLGFWPLVRLDQRRRDFKTLIGGAAAAWPLAARAQQGERMRRVAFLHPYAENDPEVLARVVAFRQGLEALGWTENRNIQIEHRYSGGDLGQIQAYATELVRSAPDLIVGPRKPKSGPR